MATKRWPEGGEPVTDAEEIVGPLAETACRIFFGERVEYDGYDYPPSVAAAHTQPAVTLADGWLKQEAEAGRLPAQTIFRVAFLLGVAQGRRLRWKDDKLAREMLRATLDSETKDPESVRSWLDVLGRAEES